MTTDPLQPDPTPAPAAPRRRGHRRRLLMVVALLLVVCVLVLPNIIAATRLRNVLLSLAFRDMNGSIRAESASLGWFRPIAFHGIEIQSDTGEPLVQVASLQGSMPLWRILLLRDDLGNFRIEQPYARVVVSPGDSNFKAVFAQQEPDDSQPDEPTNLEGVPHVNVALRIVDASISLQRVEGDPTRAFVDDPGRWLASGINISAGIRRSAIDPQQAILYVERGPLINRAEINADVAHSWLKYVAPIVADSTSTEGSFSVDLDAWQIPLDAPEQGTAGGRLTIHALDVTPGPIGRVITDLLKLPPSVVASQESVIQFELADARVHHRDLRFTLGGLPVKTHGWVGLDQTLEIMAEVTLPQFQNEEAPIRRALSGRVLVIPIRGTLNKPEVDAQALTRSGMGILNDVLSNLGERIGADLPQIAPPGEQMASPLPPVANGSADGEPLSPEEFNWQQTIESAIPLVQEAIRNRRERMRAQAEQERASEPIAPDGLIPQQYPQPERPLRTRMRRLLQTLGPPEESAAPPSPGAPAPGYP